MNKPYAEMTPEQLERVKASKRKWRVAHRKEYADSSKRWRESEQGRAKTKAWREANREHINANKRDRRRKIAKKFNVSIREADATYTRFHRHLRDVLGDTAIKP